MRSRWDNFRGVWAIPLGCLLLSPGCKPKSEADFPWGKPPADYPKLEIKKAEVRPKGEDEAEARRPVEAEDEEEEVAPDPEPPPIVVGEDVAVAPSAPDAGPAPEVAEAPAPDAAVAAPDALPPLDPAIEATLQKRPTSAEKLESRRLNTEGLKRHKLKDYAGAAKFYQEALDNDPTAMLPRYNLACALSLSRQPELALQHLLVHQALGHKMKLQDARADADFEPMRKDPRFRKLTGYADVVIFAAEAVPSTVSEDVASAILKAVRFPAALGVAPSAVKETAVYYREGYAAAARQVASVIGDLKPQPMPARLAGEAGDVFVMVASEEDVAAASQRGLERFFDRALSGKSGDRAFTLRIKATTFFDQTILDGADKIKRSGTWKVEGDELVISYREIHETEGDAPPPEEASDRVKFRVDGDVLIVDGVRYSP